MSVNTGIPEGILMRGIGGRFVIDFEPPRDGDRGGYIELNLGDWVEVKLHFNYWVTARVEYSSELGGFYLSVEGIPSSLGIGMPAKFISNRLNK